MRSIVIVCMGGGSNFGACLQSYALQRVLASMGLDVRIWFPSKLRYSLKSVFYYALNLSRLHDFWLWLRTPRSIWVKTTNLRRWHRKHYKSERLFLPFQLRRLVRNTDCFCVGSDQVWNTYHHFCAELFLNFAGNKKRISYASSVGTFQINPIHEVAVKQFLRRFDNISVREETGRIVLEKLTGRKDIRRVLDPTLLIGKEDWLRFADDAHFDFLVPQRYIMCYFLADNSNYQNDLEEVRRRFGVEDVIFIPAAEAPDLRIKGARVCHGLTPTEFVWLLANATVVCTDSFHASIFSVNMGRDFVVFKRFVTDTAESQNSRLYDVLDLFKLQGRWFDKNLHSWSDPIEWSVTNVVLERERKKSMSFLWESVK